MTYYDSNHENITRRDLQMQEWKQPPYLEQMPIAMAYVPWQRNCTMYENLDEAYKTGTIFPILNKPFMMGGKRGYGLQNM